MFIFNKRKKEESFTDSVNDERSISARFRDGLSDMLSALSSRRSASSRNRITHKKLSSTELIDIYKNGVANKIFRILTGSALSETINFQAKEQELIYKAKLEDSIKLAAMYQLAFGRGIIVLWNDGDDLETELTNSFDPDKLGMRVFSGDMVTVSEYSRDLMSDRYYKPINYVVRGQTIHYSRVIDFTYVMPVENEMPTYRFGGVPLSELIYEQLVNDGVIERAASTIIDKNSSFFYKIEGFKDMLRNKKESDLVSYITTSEDNRSIYGAGIIDAQDEVLSISQALTNLKEVDDISLRRLSLVTGIPVSILVGESVKGLNASGENEQKTFIESIKSYQSFYLIDPINDLMNKLGMDPVNFQIEKGLSPEEQANYEKVILGNAAQMALMGEDYASYLADKGITKKDDVDNFFDA